jgi:hypothetical protein
MAQFVQLELRVNLLKEEVKQLRAQNIELVRCVSTLQHTLNLAAVRLESVSDNLESGMARHLQTVCEVVVQQTQDRRDIDRLSTKVQALLMWLPWLNRVFCWWCKRQSSIYGVGYVIPL